MKLLILFSLVVLLNFAFGQNESKTIVSPTKNISLNTKNSVIYCASTEIMWNELLLFLKAPVKTKQSNSTIELLNAAVIDYKVPLENQFYVAKSGLVKKGIIEDINKELKAKFDIIWDKRQNFTSKDFVAYSFLKKEITFKKPLEDEFPRIAFNNKEYVDYFGLERTNSKNVLIHDYKNENDFIVELKCEDSLDQIFFVKAIDVKNLENLYKNSMERINLNQYTQILENEKLKIPFLKFDTIKKYSEVENSLILNKKLKKANIESFEQQIDFELNQQGVKLYSKSELIMTFLDVEIKREYIFDQPFLVIMKRKNQENPYFLYWVTNTDFMRKYELSTRQINLNEGLLVGKWRYLGKRVDGETREKTRDIDIEFFDNGTFKSVQNNNIQTGNWKFSKEKMEIKIHFNDPESLPENDIIWKLTQLSDNAFEIEGKVKMYFAKQN